MMWKKLTLTTGEFRWVNMANVDLVVPILENADLYFNSGRVIRFRESVEDIFYRSPMVPVRE